MMRRDLTDEEVQHIVERTVLLPSGRQSTAPRFQSVDLVALKDDLNFCPYWYSSAQKVRAKGHHTARSKRAREIERTAQSLLGLVSDELGKQCVTDFSGTMTFPEGTDPLSMVFGSQFNDKLLVVYLAHIQIEAQKLRNKIEVLRGGFGYFDGSSTDWLVGEGLASIFEKRFGQRPGISKQRAIKSDGTELAPPGGAYIRFVTATLDVYRLTHGIDLQLKPETIADALKTGRQGGVRKRRVTKRTSA